MPGRAEDVRPLLLPFAEAAAGARAAGAVQNGSGAHVEPINGGDCLGSGYGQGGALASGTEAEGMHEAGASPAARMSGLLLSAAQAAEGLSGRALRKLPFLAHAAAPQRGGGAAGGRLGAVAYLRALLDATLREQDDRVQLHSG